MSPSPRAELQVELPRGAAPRGSSAYLAWRKRLGEVADLIDTILPPHSGSVRDLK